MSVYHRMHNAHEIAQQNYYYIFIGSVLFDAYILCRRDVFCDELMRSSKQLDTIVIL